MKKKFRFLYFIIFCFVFINYNFYAMNRRDFKDIINNCPELCFAIKNRNFDRAKMLIRDLVSHKKITPEIISSVLFVDGKDEVVKFLLQDYIEQTKENNGDKNLETQNNYYSSSDYD